MYDNEFDKNLNNQPDNTPENQQENQIIETPDVQDISEKIETEEDLLKIPPEVFEMRSDIPVSESFEENQVQETEIFGTSETPETFEDSGKTVEPETAEIVYDTDKKTGDYSCNFVENERSSSFEKKSKSAGTSIWLKVAALIIAAMFTLTFMAYVGFSIADDFFRDDDFLRFENGKIADRDDIFQMERPGNRIPDNRDQAVIKNENTTGELTVGQISEKCKKSSVGIMIEKETYYFGRTYKTSGVGSGFILSEDGYIATNSHVVDGATTITVMLDSGESYEAVLVGKDTITDIAVVKIEATGLPVMERGNSDEVKVGDTAVAIGTPASIELAGTVTDGIISAVGRKIDITDDYGNVIKTMTLIQTNATINPGNSGGPLINSYGQVIGINTLKLTAQYEGIGFAIPINGAIDIMNQLIADGKVSDRGTSLVTGAPSIGISCADISDAEAEYYGIPKGVLVIQINKASQASQAGLRRGDIILEFQGEKVETSDELTEIKDRYKPDDVVTMKVYRDGEGELEITFKLDIKE